MKGLRQHERLDGPAQTALSKRHYLAYKTPNMALLCPVFLLLHVKQKKQQSYKIVISNHLKSQGEKTLERKVNKTKLTQAGWKNKLKRSSVKAFLLGQTRTRRQSLSVNHLCEGGQPQRVPQLPRAALPHNNFSAQELSAYLGQMLGTQQQTEHCPCPQGTHNLMVRQQINQQVNTKEDKLGSYEDIGHPIRRARKISAQKRPGI